MAEGKKSFIAYSDWQGTFKALPDEIAGQLIKYLFSYVNDENPEPHENFVVNALFEQFKATLKRDLDKWGKQREQRSLAGKKSAEIRKAKSNERSTVVNEKTRKATVSDSVSVSVNVNEIIDKSITTINNNSFLAEATNSSQWLETSAMQNQVSLDVIKIFLNHFNDHLITMEEQKKNLKEYKQHFIHWLKKQDLSQHRRKVIGRTNQA